MAGQKKTTTGSTNSQAKMTSKDLAIYVGMQAELNGREITLAPKTPINQVDIYGLELELPDTVFLGKLGDTADNLIENFTPEGSNAPKMSDLANTGIGAIDNIIKKVSDAELSLSKFHVNIPSQYEKDENNDLKKDKEGKPVKLQQNDPKGKTEYTVGLAATWSNTKSTSKEKMGGFDMTIKGLFVMFSNEDQEDLDQIQMIKDATAEAQKILAPAREFQAKKLKAQQDISAATKLKAELEAAKTKAETIKDSLTAQTNDKDRATDFLKNADDSIAKAETILKDAEKALQDLISEASLLEKLAEEVNKIKALPSA
jgi:hypothetical protein